MKIRIKIFLILLIQCLTLNIANARYRIVYLNQEIKTASLIKEIKIVGYYSVIDTLGTKSSNDSEARKIITEIRYVYLDKLDSIIKYYPSKKYGTVYLDIKKDTATVNLKEGFWPAIGENVLTVFDSTGEISLFASFEDETNYQFWSPYHSTSWVTIFYASKPFVTDTTVQFLPQQMELDLQKKASDSGYEFASFYRCKIGKKDFWSYLSEMTVPNIKKD